MRIIAALAVLLMPCSVSFATLASTPITGVTRNARLLDCPGAAVARWADRGPLKAEARKLGELPPGKLMLSVYREVDGCPEETVLRSGVGASWFGRR